MLERSHNPWKHPQKFHISSWSRCTTLENVGQEIALQYAMLRSVSYQTDLTKLFRCIFKCRKRSNKVTCTIQPWAAYYRKTARTVAGNVVREVASSPETSYTIVLWCNEVSSRLHNTVCVPVQRGTWCAEHDFDMNFAWNIKVFQETFRTWKSWTNVQAPCSTNPSCRMLYSDLTGALVGKSIQMAGRSAEKK